ncbi:MAG: glycosyltransferase family 4 protein [Pyrinomonadaceae bacterium]|nr:glycosyltransferase family 4 protein [Pyrinomonadaceae bacterium]
MRIIYDGSIYQEQGVGGINRYFANLIRRLPPDFEPHVTTCRKPGGTDPSHQHLHNHRFRRFRPRRFSLKLEKRFFGRVENSITFDIAHPTYYTLLSQREFSDYRCPVVITVWDMIHELFPKLDPSGLVAEQKRRAIEAADTVLCISENTRRDLLARHRIAESKVWVTPLASDLDPNTVESHEPGPSRPYFLSVGARAGYKNFDGLLLALASAKALVPDVALRAVGLPFTRDETKRIAELGLTGRVEGYGLVSDRQLVGLYRHSVAFVYPSLYEGFGIPLLEAMQCGTPVVASNRASIPEVVGDAGVLFDPSRADELSDILVGLVQNPASREPLIERGYKRARQFSWEKTVERTVEVYRTLAG